MYVNKRKLINYYGLISFSATHITDIEVKPNEYRPPVPPHRNIKNASNHICSNNPDVSILIYNSEIYVYAIWNFSIEIGMYEREYITQ